MEREDEDEAELRRMLERLDEMLPVDGAHVTIPASADAPTIGNRAGYLRLGLELMIAALDPVAADDPESARIVPRLQGIFSEGSRSPFERCELDEAIAARPPVQSRLGAVGQMATGVLVVLVLILAFIGAAVVWRFVLRY